MLRYRHILFFPKLVHIGETNFKSWSDSTKKTDLYKLDWSFMDPMKEKQSHFYDLPEEYEEWVKNLEFAIPHNYLEEIRRCARKAAEERNIKRSFDTMIRDICMEPSITFSYVAFRLLGDCLYDRDSNYFYRNDDKYIAPYAMLYKFWSLQTGRGLIKEHSHFRNLQRIISKSALFGAENIQMTGCPKCGERLFLEATTEGWKVETKEITCSCGEKCDLPQPGSTTTDTEELTKVFLRRIRNQEKDLEAKLAPSTSDGVIPIPPSCLGQEEGGTEPMPEKKVGEGTEPMPGSVKEKQRPHKVFPMEISLTDFLELKSGKSILDFQETTIDIPEVGIVTLSNPKLYKMFLPPSAFKSINFSIPDRAKKEAAGVPEGGMKKILELTTLKSEVQFDRPDKLMDCKKPFTFKLYKGGATLAVTAYVDKLSSTPPIELYLYIDKIDVEYAEEK